MKCSALALAALVLVVPVVGCGGGSDDAKIALLLPGNKTERLESSVRPDFEKKIEEICNGCEVLYSNASGHLAQQYKQAEAALRQGAEAIVVDPVLGERASGFVEKANARNVPVLDYDDLILDAEPAVFVSYDNVAVGELAAKGLAGKLKEDGSPTGPVVLINGEPGNSDEAQFEEGAHKGFAVAGVEIKREFDTAFWDPENARHEMHKAIATYGSNGFAGVYAETDGLAGGAIRAMKMAGIDPSEKPTVGFDATVAAVRRILAGDQYMTVYEPIGPEASSAAEIAVDLAEGEEVPQEKISDELENEKTKVPSVLLKPVAVTKDNVKQTVVADGFIAPSELCTGPYEAACKEAGISG